MAASIVIPARTERGDRTVVRTRDVGVVARAAARTAPRGPGLAEVVALPVRAGARTVMPAVALRGAGVAADAVARPTLRVVPAPTRTAPRWGRLVATLIATALVLAGSVMAVRGALADPSMPVAAGHVVLEPGETLWDVAVRSAPAGVDPRAQLDALQRLNGFGSAALDAWTVVLIPAP